MMRKLVLLPLVFVLATFVQIGIGDMMARLGWVLMPLHIMLGIIILGVVAALIKVGKTIASIRIISITMLLLLALQIAMGFDMFMRGVTETIETIHQFLAYVIFISSLAVLGIGYKTRL